MSVQSAGFGLTFHSGFFANLLDIDEDGLKREALENTDQATPVDSGSIYQTYQPSVFIDSGEVKLKFRYNPTKGAPPIDQPAETITVTYPIPPGGSTASTVAGSGFLTDYALTGVFKNLVEGTATLKKSGKWTYTAGT